MRLNLAGADRELPSGLEGSGPRNEIGGAEEDRAKEEGAEGRRRELKRSEVSGLWVSGEGLGK